MPAFAGALLLLAAAASLVAGANNASANATAGGGAIAVLEQPLVLQPLPYPYDALEPVISQQIMRLHQDAHNAAYVRNANAALAPPGAAPGNQTLPSVLLEVGRAGSGLNASQATAARNNGGGAWNHRLFWGVMAPPGSANTSRSAISAPLQSAIDSAFGSVDDMLARLKRVADAHFGSGWAWLCVPSGGGALQILDTANQDNPLMGVVIAEPCVPILGLDVWEHAYYLQYGPKKPDYTAAWLTIINWAQVSANRAEVLRGNLAFNGVF